MKTEKVKGKKFDISTKTSRHTKQHTFIKHKYVIQTKNTDKKWKMENNEKRGESFLCIYMYISTFMFLFFFKHKM